MCGKSQEALLTPNDIMNSQVPDNKIRNENKRYVNHTEELYVLFWVI